MVVNMYKHMGKVVIKFLQGSAVTLTMLNYQGRQSWGSRGPQYFAKAPIHQSPTPHPNY